jgi:hypothetical protein
MGLLTSFGKHVKGLLGDDAFFDRLAQAQAFANGDPATAATIGAEIRKRKADKAGAASQIAPLHQAQSQPPGWPLETLDLETEIDLRRPPRLRRTWRESE